MTAEKFDPANQVPKLSWWFTHDEFQLVWVFQWVAYHWKCYGMDEMPEEAADEIYESLGKALRWSAAVLGCKYGVEFSGIRVDEAGGIYLKQERPIEPRNEMFLYRHAEGKQPDPKAALETALRMIAEHRWTIPTEPLRQALSEVDKSYQEAKATIDPETDQLMGKAIHYAMRRAGYIRSDDEAN